MSDKKTDEMDSLENKEIDDMAIEENEAEKESEKESKKESGKEKLVLEYKKIKPIWYIVWLIMLAGIIVFQFIVSKEGTVGLVRKLVLPILAGFFGYMLIYAVLNLLAKKMKKGLRGLYIVSQILLYIVVIFIGYSILNPIKDIVKGPEKVEIEVYHIADTEYQGSLLITSNNNGLDGQYRLNITIKDNSNETVYDFPIDKKTYHYFKENQNQIGWCFDLSYYKNTNVLIEFEDTTDEKLREFFEENETSTEQ